MERPTMNEAHSGGLADASNQRFREQTEADAAGRERDDATLEFEGRMRLTGDDEFRCDPYNRVGRFTRAAR